MGGIFGGGSSTNSVNWQPSVPVQDNSSQLLMMQQQLEQSRMMNEQSMIAMAQQGEADDAAMEQEAMLAAKEAQEVAELEERRYRMSKGKKDLLYSTALGASDADSEDEEDSQGLLKLGGNY